MRIVTDIPEKFIAATREGRRVACEMSEAAELVDELRRVADEIETQILDRSPEPIRRRRASAATVLAALEKPC